MDRMTNSQPSALVAVSGGVDSSVAALLLKQQGYRIRAVTMKLYCYGETITPESCCSTESTDVAREAMRRLGAEFQVVYLQDLFKERVIDPFFEEYRAGRTPNPCVSCNAGFRFPLLARLAKEMECDCFATGHYARVVEDGGRRYLARGRDPKKDQSYFLWGIPNQLLDRILFPVGDLIKDEVRELARKADLPTASRPESQEVCFLPPGGYREVMLQQEGPGEPGPIVDEDGRRLGEHAGIVNYTVGQRKGLGIAAPHPLYVVRVDRESNTVVAGPKASLDRKVIRISGFRWYGDERPAAGSTGGPAGADAPPSPATQLAAEGSIRYRNPPKPCVIEPDGRGGAVVRFTESQSAPTPGQALVFYRGDRVMGGGTIDEVIE